MPEFAMHSFCTACGKHRGQMPFGVESDFFDRDPCRSCGARGPGEQYIAGRARVGRWPWQRGWVRAASSRAKGNA